jgi:hypothetical protein
MAQFKSSFVSNKDAKTTHTIDFTPIFFTNLDLAFGVHSEAKSIKKPIKMSPDYFMLLTLKHSLKNRNNL